MNKQLNPELMVTVWIYTTVSTIHAWYVRYSISHHKE